MILAKFAVDFQQAKAEFIRQNSPDAVRDIAPAAVALCEIATLTSRFHADDIKLQDDAKCLSASCCVCIAWLLCDACHPILFSPCNITAEVMLQTARLYILKFPFLSIID